MEHSKLKPNPDNPRTISTEAFDRLKGKIERNPDGLTANKIVYKDGIIIAGNQRFRALLELKLELKDDWFKDVSGWTTEQIREYLVTSNVSDGEWDYDLLANQYEMAELEAWGVELPKYLQESEVVEDNPPELSSEPPESQSGSIYQLGRHRLMCGDSTDKENVDNLMDGTKADMVFTDPPYGIDVVGKEGKIGGNSKVYSKVIGDDKPYDPNHLFDWSDKLFIWGANYFSDKLPLGNWVVWDKQRQEGLTFSDCELAWTNRKGIAIKMFRYQWDGFMGREEDGRVHPTQKPIKLLGQILNELYKEEVTTLDLFGGSGSTLIACEQLDRTCYMMELDPKYCDVIRKRFAKLTDPENWEASWQTMTPKI